MNRHLLVIAMTALLAANTAGAAETNRGSLGHLSPKSAARPAQNRVELAIGGGTVGNLFGESSGPALSGRFEHQISEELSLGVELARSTSRYAIFDIGGEYGYKYANNTLLGRVSYHTHDLIDDERVDLYGGGRLGFNRFTASSFGPQAQQPLGRTSYMLAGGFTGGRFWFNPKFGANAEIGYNYALYSAGAVGGLSYGSASAGVSMRF